MEPLNKCETCNLDYYEDYRISAQSRKKPTRFCSPNCRKASTSKNIYNPPHGKCSRCDCALSLRYKKCKVCRQHCGRCDNLLNNSEKNLRYCDKCAIKRHNNKKPGAEAIQKEAAVLSGPISSMLASIDITEVVKTNREILINGKMFYATSISRFLNWASDSATFSSIGTSYGGFSGLVRQFLLDEQGGVCNTCGGPPTHNSKPLIFILDHINGDSTNNTRQNLRLVCPNCDTQLDTFKSKNKGNGRVYNRKYMRENK